MARAAFALALLITIAHVPLVINASSSYKVWLACQLAGTVLLGILPTASIAARSAKTVAFSLVTLTTLLIDFSIANNVVFYEYPVHWRYT